MSTSAGQSLIPYPWKQRKKFNDARRLISPVVKLTRLLAWVATIASPPTFIAWMWAKFAYRHYNDSWSKRGLLLLIYGVVLSLIFVRNPLDVAFAWYNMLRSFGVEATSEPSQAIIHALLIAFPYALILQGLHALARSYQIEKTTNAFLQEQRPTLGMRLRKSKNIRALTHGVNGSRHGRGYVRFGVIEHDRIPWRFSRHGMVAERRIEKMGHGVLAGANGMGKTTLASTFGHYVLEADAGMIYLDFKADLDTLRGLVAVARDSGKPCYILDIGFGSNDTSWYDLFGWPGSPADKASVLIECFQFAEGEGGASYYRGVAEAWLPMQIEAADILGLEEDEGMFDFLLATAVPDRFRKRILPMRESADPAMQAKFEMWNAEANLVKTSDLQGLRNELTKITNAAGSRLKPNPENPNPVSLREVMDNGGLIYIGIAAGVNDVVVKVLGSFLFRELSILVSARSREDKSTLRDVFFVPDEASEMEERSEMLNPLYTMARGSRVWIWPAFQTFGSWQESTQDEIQSNARSFVAFDIPSSNTAEVIGGTLANVFALKQMTQEETRQQAFQNQTIGISGDSRMEIVTDELLRSNIELTSVPKFHAYIWFKDAPIAPRGRWWGRRRVRKDENRADAPLVKIVPYHIVLPEEIDPGMEVVSDTPPRANSRPLDYDEEELRELTNTTKSASTEARPVATSHRGETVEGDVEDSFIVETPTRKTSPSQEEPPPPPDDGREGEREAASVPTENVPDAPPPLPSFAVRGARRRRDAAAASSATEVADEGSDSSDSVAQRNGGSASVQESSAPSLAEDTYTEQGAEGSLTPEPWTDDEFADDGAEQSPASESARASRMPSPSEAQQVRATEASRVVPAPIEEPSPQGEVPDASSASVSDQTTPTDREDDQSVSTSMIAEGAPAASDDEEGSEPGLKGSREGDQDSNGRADSSTKQRSVASDDDGGWFV